MTNADERNIQSPPTKPIRILGERVLSRTDIKQSVVSSRCKRKPGLIGQLDKGPKYKHSFNICINRGDLQSPMMQLDKDLAGKKKEMLLTNVLNLEQESVLTIEIFKNRSIALLNSVKKPLLTSKTVTYNDIWQHLKFAPSVEQHFEVPSDLITKGLNIWVIAEVSSINAVELPATEPPTTELSAVELPVAELPAADPPRIDDGHVDDPLQAAKARLEVVIVGLKNYKTILDHLGWAKAPVETGLEFGKAISKVHPIASIVFSCVELVYKQFKARDDSHKQMIALAKSMDGMVDYMKSIEEIPKFDKLKDTIRQFPDLMKDMADFIEKWLSSGLADSFRIFVSEGELDDLKNHLDSFEKDFDRGIIIDMRRHVTESEDGKKLKEALLRGINPYEEHRATVCMDGTRTDILSDVDIRINDLSGDNVIWITGYPGVGKSALASTIVSRQRNSHSRFVLYFRFERDKPDITTPSALWRGIAYKLACRYPSIRRSILDLILEDFDFGSPEPNHLFTSLVKTPLMESSMSDTPRDRPLVIVVDAADECGGYQGCQQSSILEAFKQWKEHIPKNFKLVVTSRPETWKDFCVISDPPISDITLISIPFGLNNETSDKDILKFLVARLGELSKSRARVGTLVPPQQREQVASDLVPFAAGVFQWAVIAVQFLTFGNYEIRLKSLKNKKAGLGPLDSLYTKVLEMSFGLSDGELKVSNGKPTKFATDEELKPFCSILGAILFAKEPLQGTNEECAEFLNVEKSDLEVVRRGLYSVMDEGDILRFSHQSFPDFLLSSACPLDFSAEHLKHHHHHQFSERCLDMMSMKLHFNICQLETSNLLNVDVYDAQIKQGIPSLLSYSCRFWADHLRDTKPAESPIETVKAVLNDKLLFWVEVMSLLKEMNCVVPILRTVLECTDPTEDGDFIAFVRDALRFIAAFITPITQSAPHIYLSALPFAPQESLVVQHFLPKFPNLITFAQGKPACWPLSVFVSEHHDAPITYVAFLADQKTFVSGDASGYICICDSETGALIAGPVFPSRDWIKCACLSPDGKSIAIGYSLMREELMLVTLDAKTGEEIRRFEGTEDTSCVAYRDGGQSIVSFSRHESGFIGKLWDPETGKPVRDLFKIPDCSDVVMSPDGRLVVSYHPGDGCFRIWNVVDQPSLQCEIQQQDISSGPLAFSPDSGFVATASSDCTICVWSSKTGEMVGQPLKYPEFPTDWLMDIRDIVFSPESNLLVLTSLTSVMAWNTSTQNIILKETGREFEYCCISLSRDARRLLIGCTDKVRLWDLTGSALPATHPTESIPGWRERKGIIFHPSGGTVAVRSEDGVSFWDTDTGRAKSPGSIVTKCDTTSFSPDGRHIASVSAKEVHIWDMETGQQAYQPMMINNHPWIHDALFPPGSDDYLAVFFGTKVCIYDFRNWQVVSSINLPDEFDMQWLSVHTVSPDCLAFATGEYDYMARYSYARDALTNEFLHVPLIDAEHSERGEVCYSPSGKLLASYYRQDRLVRVWETKTGKHFATFRSDDATELAYRNPLVFLPNEKYIASAGSELIIRDIETGHRVGGPFRGRKGWIGDIAVSRDGKKMASYVGERIIMIWDISDFQAGQPRESDGHLDESYIVDGWAMREDGERLFWVPFEHRDGLLRSRSIAIIGATPTRLNLTKFKYGREWEECIDREWRRRMECGREIVL